MRPMENPPPFGQRMKPNRTRLMAPGMQVYNTMGMWPMPKVCCKISESTIQAPHGTK